MTKALPILPMWVRGTIATGGGGGGAVGREVRYGRAPSVRPSACHFPQWGRIIGLALLLGACSKQPGVPAGDMAAGEDRVRCALSGASQAKPDCTREVAQGPDGEVWVIRHPDGGFRRFVLIDKGTRIATADGAAEVRAERVGAQLDVRVADERYLFPAAAHAAR